MSKIRSQNTKAELLVFRELKKRGIYFQKHYKKAPGNPDIALPRKKKAVFIDGDFWHGRDYKRTIDRLPEGYWKDKIKRNVSRDRKYRKVLISQGWQILHIWESDISRKHTRIRKLQEVAKFLKT